MLGLISLPSFKLLYLADEVIDPSLVICAEGLLLWWPYTIYLLCKYDENTIISVPYLYRSSTLNTSYTRGRGIIFNKLKINFTRCFHTKVKASRRIGPHNEDVLSVLVGSLLGDCYGNRRSVEGTRFCFRQSVIHREYLFWLYDFFFSRGYCSNLKPRKYTRDLSNGKQYFGYEFNTFTFRSFDWVYNMFYRKGRKIINPKIDNYLTPLALAVWIMDDGGWVGSGVRISTYNFSIEETKFLIYLLEESFNLHCTIQILKNGNQSSIYIKKESIPKLREIVFPYMHFSMYHKIGINGAPTSPLFPSR